MRWCLDKCQKLGLSQANQHVGCSGYCLLCMKLPQKAMASDNPFIVSLWFFSFVLLCLVLFLSQELRQSQTGLSFYSMWHRLGSVGGIRLATGLVWRVKDGFIYMPVALTETAGSELSLLLPLHCHLRTSPHVLSFRVVTLLTLWHRGPRSQGESCQSTLG